MKAACPLPHLPVGVGERVDSFGEPIGGRSAGAAAFAGGVVQMLGRGPQRCDVIAIGRRGSRLGLQGRIEHAGRGGDDLQLLRLIGRE